MATKKQIQANRSNAQRSTGPRTNRGKATSSKNAVKHGLFAKQILLTDEDAYSFGQLRARLYDEWVPLGATETMVLERLVALFWRQQRLYRVESGLFTINRGGPTGTGGVGGAIAADKNNVHMRVIQMDSAVERSIQTTIGCLQKLQKDRSLRSGLAPISPAREPCPHAPPAAAQSVPKT